jgi:hypothetical protein
VESVDLLSTDEVYESIGADMPDHDRRSSHAHLLPRVSMNTRRQILGDTITGLGGRAKPSMTVSVEPQKLLKTWLIKY